MILIQAIIEDFRTDQIIGAFSLTVTLLVFLLMFGVLLYESEKEERKTDKNA